MENGKTQLCGIKAICSACRNLELPSSEPSVMSMIIHEYFPAKKIGGVWISDMDMITTWRQEQIQTRPERELKGRIEPPPPTKTVKQYVISKKGKGRI